MTTDQVRARRKTVTRRLGWQWLQPGTELTLCPKVRGRAPGEELERIANVRVTHVDRVKLGAITAEDVAREGFPQHSPQWFVDFFCKALPGCTADTVVTRIEFTYLS
ncbi:ASCH domain-containing protein [Nocardia sp. IFM 10818]